MLRLATEDDYLLLGRPKDVLAPQSPPGRGVVNGKEVQVAVLGASPNLAVQARELAALADAMGRHGAAAAPTIGRLASDIPLSSLPDEGPDRVVIAVDDETLAPTAIDARGPLLLSGPPGSGRTTALSTIVTAVRGLPAARTIIHFAPRRSDIRGTVDASYFGAGEVAQGARQWIAALDRGEVAAGALVVVLEALAEFTGTEAEVDLERLVKEALRADQLVIGEAESSTWSQAYLLAAPFKAGRRGLLLVPGELEGDSLLGTSLGRFRRADLPPGRGFLVERGKVRKVQVAQP